jgi:hypothetical protein
MILPRLQSNQECPADKVLPRLSGEFEPPALSPIQDDKLTDDNPTSLARPKIRQHGNDDAVTRLRWHLPTNYTSPSSR